MGIIYPSFILNANPEPRHLNVSTLHLSPPFILTQAIQSFYTRSSKRNHPSLAFATAVWGVAQTLAEESRFWSVGTRKHVGGRSLLKQRHEATYSKPIKKLSKPPSHTLTPFRTCTCHRCHQRPVEVETLRPQASSSSQVSMRKASHLSSLLKQARVTLIWLFIILVHVPVNVSVPHLYASYIKTSNWPRLHGYYGYCTDKVMAGSGTKTHV